MTKMIAGILLEGMKTWNQERRLSFQKKYHKIIKALESATNESDPSYTDGGLALAKKDVSAFEQAYFIELQLHNKEALGV